MWERPDWLQPYYGYRVRHRVDRRKGRVTGGGYVVNDRYVTVRFKGQDEGVNLSPDEVNVRWQTLAWRGSGFLVGLVIAAAGLLFIVALALSIVVAAFDRGPECDSAAACEDYEQPEDVGIP